MNTNDAAISANRFPLGWRPKSTEQDESGDNNNGDDTDVETIRPTVIAPPTNAGMYRLINPNLQYRVR